MAGLRQQQSILLRQVGESLRATYHCNAHENVEQGRLSIFWIYMSKSTAGSMISGVPVFVQVFAQVAKDYLSPASTSSSVSARNVLAGFRRLQRRSFFQNSSRDIPADPKAQVIAARCHEAFLLCGLEVLQAVMMVNDSRC